MFSRVIFMKECDCWMEQRCGCSVVSYPLSAFHRPSPAATACSVLQQGDDIDFDFRYYVRELCRAEAKDSRKRKMKGVAVESAEPAHQINFFNLQGQKFTNQNPFANAPPFVNGGNSRVQQILNAAAPFKSFTSMLAFAVEDGGTSGSTEFEHQSKELDQIIASHGENLRREIAVMMEKNQHSIHYAVEERTAKKLKEMEFDIRTKLRENVELEKKAEHYKAEAQRLHRRVMYLEQMAMSLKEGLASATSARRFGENAQEDAESSFVDTERVGLVRLDCLVCEKKIATVMMWPCRHVCLCSECDAVTKSCPFCLSIKTSSVKVHLPLEQEGFNH